jgi:phosphate transport system ATP-binding protein
VRALNRMTELTPGLTVEGSVLYQGQNIYDRSIDPVLVRRRIGMVFQRPTVFPMSIFENAAFGLRVMRESEDVIDAAVPEALTRAGLWEEVKGELDRSAFSLSGGQQQRLCIARALAVRPKVLLLDEPTSALDPKATQRLELTMQRLKEEIVLVLVTHNVGQAARVSDRVAYLNAGRLIEQGPTAEILERPRETLTQEFVTGHFT